VTMVAAYGLAFDVPPGWDGRIYQRPPDPGQTTHPVLHAGNFGLPDQRGDYGAGAVEMMGPQNVFVALLEFHPDSTGAALFSSTRPERIDPAAFSPASLQRAIPGQAGTQAFFSDAGRAFGLYAVLGGYAARANLVPLVNDAVSRITIT